MTVWIGAMPTKIIVSLPDATVEAIKAIAERRGTSMTEAIADSIEMNKFLLDQEARDSKVLLERADGKFERVVRP
jgi:hypothetical protein